MLGGLAAETGFSAAEIADMSRAEVIFWWNCVSVYRAKVAEAIKENR